MANPKPIQLSRRDFLKLSSTASLGLALSACGFSPTLIATPKLTNTLSPTPIKYTTPTETPLPTATNIPEPSGTPTVTNTPKPTDTPRPIRIIFQSDFSNGLDVVKAAADHWNFLHEDGTNVEIIPDPTNSLDNSGRPRGNVMKVTIHGDPVQHPDWFGSKQWWRSGGPDWTYGYPVKLVRAPSGIQVDVNKLSDLNGIGLLSVHRQNKYNQNDRTSIAGFEIYSGDNLVLVVRDGQGKDTRVNLKRGLFKSDQWNTLRLDFLPDGGVIPFVNGQNAYAYITDLLKVPVDADYDAGFADGHAGILTANKSKNDGFKEGQYLLNDNFLVFEYQ